MKLIVAIVQAYDTDRLLRSVTSAGFRVTRIQSTGGFLRAGNSTVFMGVEDDRAQECLGLIRESARSRVETAPGELEAADAFELTGGDVASVAVGGAVVFVLPVTRFERFVSGAQTGWSSLA
ncbi:MAG: cyclic-di-AMP receptor [Thermomicrobiales bacterium]|nr:cyclic-di-AMP receptor [Thermomicrobiales bacterium]MCO5222357.1 cyclic-di-AMP receptor [Thermomicrobiales bacterium]